MNECSVIVLKEKLDDAGSIRLVDVRERGEFAGGRAAGAECMPLTEIDRRHQELDHSRPVYVMCRTGRRSSEAQRKLRTLGFTDVVNVVGGFEEWKRHDLPVDRDERAPWSIERQVRFTAGLLVLIGVLLGAIVSPYFFILPGLIGFGLTFTAMIDWCGMGLLLARMPWNRV